MYSKKGRPNKAAPQTDVYTYSKYFKKFLNQLQSAGSDLPYQDFCKPDNIWASLRTLFEATARGVGRGFFRRIGTQSFLILILWFYLRLWQCIWQLFIPYIAELWVQREFHGPYSDHVWRFIFTSPYKRVSVGTISIKHSVRPCCPVSKILYTLALNTLLIWSTKSSGLKYRRPRTRKPLWWHMRMSSLSSFRKRRRHKCDGNNQAIRIRNDCSHQFDKLPRNM